jgi:cytochrome c peroxidase
MLKILALNLTLVLSLKSFAFVALPATSPEPKDNPTTKAKAELGKVLFFDPRLSIDGTISCNSCHNLMAGGDDSRPVSVGIKGQRGGRSAPTVWNSGFNTVQFWDGRAASLEDQAKGPLTNPIEMGMKDHQMVVDRIKMIPGYVEMFNKAFGNKDSINIDNYAKAVAAFERTLITHNSPFDKYKKGNKKAMSASAVRGMKLVDEIGCTSCHTGVNFNGEGQKMGEGNYQKFPQIPGSKFDKQYDLVSDLGRYDVTKNADDKNMWRVPTWRNVALTAPYFHNGKVATLDEAVKVMAMTQLGIELTADQTNDIVAFLEALTGTFPAMTMPRLPNYEKKTFTPNP